MPAIIVRICYRRVTATGHKGHEGLATKVTKKHKETFVIFVFSVLFVAKTFVSFAADR